MWKLAIDMLIGDRAKYIGMILGLTFASFIMIQQSAIFVGLMTRTYGFVSDTGQADIWVMDKKVQFIDDTKPIKSTYLYRVWSVPGVEWAVPLYKALLRVRLKSGNFQQCNVIGIDDASLIGGPPEMLEGDIEDLRDADSVIVNEVGANDKLATTLNDGSIVPLKVGDVIEINDKRAKVVGICKVSRTFQSQPVIYTTFSRALSYAPPERKLMTFILAKADPKLPIERVCNHIEASTGLAAYPSPKFEDLTVDYYMKRTGIPINFGTAVILGFIIGAAIAGQTFFNFTIDNLKFFGTFKAMGASNKLLVKMVLLQAVIVGVIGWGIGLGAASFFGLFSRNTELSFRLTGELAFLSGAAVMVIVMFAALLSSIKVCRLEPSIVFKG